jgi:hypothetical protein
MPELSPGQIIWPLMSILSSVAVIAGMIIAIVKLNRRIPPMAEEAAKTYATKIEMQELGRQINDRIDREMDFIGKSNADQTRKLDSLITTTNRSSEETQRSLGRIEGKLDAHLEQHA